MDLSVSLHNSIPVLQVDGDIDMATASELAAALEWHSGSCHSSVLIDLTRCPFLDSGGLNVLLQAVRRMEGLSWLGVVGPNRNLRRVFEIIGLASDPRFRLLDDLSEIRG
jgi:anti-anti-sigma factor